MPEMEATGGERSRKPRWAVWIFLVILFILTLTTGVALWIRSQPPEPSFQGKRLTEWLVDLDYSHRPPDVTASNAVAQMGTNILPFLKPMLRAHDSKLKVTMMDLLAKQSLVKIHFTRADQRRESASCACRVLGPAALCYLPELTDMLDSRSRSTPWSGLVAIMGVAGRTNCAPELTKALTSPMAQTRWYAAMILGDEKAQYKPAVTNLLRNLKDADPKVRRESAQALGKIRLNVPALIGPLIALLDDTNAAVRVESAIALGRLTPDSQPARTKLIQLRVDKDSNVQGAALRALTLLDEKSNAGP